MRYVLAGLLLAAALWQAFADWQATIGEGYAYRFTSIGRALENAFPERFPGVVDGWRNIGIEWLWDPVGQTLLGLPLALVLIIVAALVWYLRRRQPKRLF